MAEQSNLPQGVERYSPALMEDGGGAYMRRNGIGGVWIKVADLPKIIAQARQEEREKLAKRLEEVDAGLSGLRRRREREGKEHSASYLQGRQHECRNQAASLRGLDTVDLRANRWSDALTGVIGAARSWLVREYGDDRPNHPADEAGALLFDALATLDSDREGEDQ